MQMQLFDQAPTEDAGGVVDLGEMRIFTDGARSAVFGLHAIRLYGAGHEIQVGGGRAMALFDGGAEVVIAAIREMNRRDGVQKREGVLKATVPSLDALIEKYWHGAG